MPGNFGAVGAGGGAAAVALLPVLPPSDGQKDFGASVGKSPEGTCTNTRGETLN